jgi:CheY-like chemotaxis protein
VPCPPASHAAAHDLSGVQVLVVDDEDDARELIKRILNDCNAEVLTAATAAEALNLLQHERPDLMVSDLGMPGRWLRLLDRIRALGPARGGDLPAIALTAFARRRPRQGAVQRFFGTHCQAGGTQRADRQVAGPPHCVAQRHADFPQGNDSFLLADAAMSYKQFENS